MSCPSPKADGQTGPELPTPVDKKLGEAARELESDVIAQAETERWGLFTSGKEFVAIARAQAEEIDVQTQLERDELARSVEKIRQEVDQVLAEGRTLAEGRAQVVWDRAASPHRLKKCPCAPRS